MAFAPGTEAYVEIAGVQKTFDSWSLDMSADTVDMSDFDRPSARFTSGLPVALLVLSGPYSVGALGMFPKAEYLVVLGLTEDVGVEVTVLVKSVKPATSVGGVARVEVAGVVNSDFMTEPTIADL